MSEFTTIRELKAENARLREALELFEGREWQPIETAPRDGTDVLLLCGKSWCAVGRYAPIGCWIAEPSHEPYSLYPTHWMPLPEPPKDKDISPALVEISVFDTPNSVAPGQVGLSPQDRGGPDTDDQAAPGSTSVSEPIPAKGKTRYE